MRTIRVKWLWPLVVLCTLAGLRWTLDATLPQSSSTLLSAAIACVLLALASAVAAWQQGVHATFAKEMPARGTMFKARVLLVVCGAGLLAAPFVGAVLRGVAADGYDRTAALCFVALITALIVGARNAGGLRARDLAVSLAMIAGALLVFPLSLPRSPADVLGLLLPVLAVAAATVGLASEPFGWREAALAAAGGAAMLLLLLLVARMQGQAVGPVPMHVANWFPVLLDTLVLGLALLAVHGNDAVSYAARWGWTPAVTVLSAVAIERPGWQPRLLVGALLLFASGVALVWPAEVETANSTRLFG